MSNIYREEAFQKLLDSKIFDKIEMLRENKLSNFEFSSYIADILALEIKENNTVKNLLVKEINNKNELIEGIESIKETLRSKAPYFGEVKQ